MKNRNRFVAAMLAITLAFGLMVMGCNGPDPGPDKLSLAEVKELLQEVYDDGEDENHAGFTAMLAGWKEEGLTGTYDGDPKAWSEAQWNTLYAWLDSKGLLVEQEGEEEEAGPENTGGDGE
jgi:hypothetical protein